MVQPDVRGLPQSDPGGIDVEDDGFAVDAALLARLLDVPASDVQTLMREGRITSLCEKGVEEHTDQFRLTFFHGSRRACIRVDPSGRILTRSVVDFGSKAASRAISDAGRRDLPRPAAIRKVTAPAGQGIIGGAMSHDDELHDAPAASLVALSLEAVIVAVTDERPRLLVSSADRFWPTIPSGPLDVEGDVTLERGLRRWVRSLTGFELGYVEQLYTFGGRNRRLDGGAPLLTVAYLALMHEEQPSTGTAWVDYYDLLPWEDHRGGRPPCLEGIILPRLKDWAGRDDTRRARVRESFGVAPMPWDAVRVLERYELLYEARLIAEHFADRGMALPTELPAGTPLAYDHRRIAASALGRLRGKLTYRPVVFELLPDVFTLTQLQRTVETLIGLCLHKQNFRRLVEQGRLVEGTGRYTASTGGRPAELFGFREEVRAERPRPGLLRPGH